MRRTARAKEPRVSAGFFFLLASELDQVGRYNQLKSFFICAKHTEVIIVKLKLI